MPDAHEVIAEALWDGVSPAATGGYRMARWVPASLSADFALAALRASVGLPGDGSGGDVLIRGDGTVWAVVEVERAGWRPLHRLGGEGGIVQGLTSDWHRENESPLFRMVTLADAYDQMPPMAVSTGPSHLDWCGWAECGDPAHTPRVHSRGPARPVVDEETGDGIWRQHGDEWTGARGSYPGPFGTVAYLRERLVAAGEEVERLRNSAAAMHHMSEHSRLVGKKDGIALALSYLDEMATSSGDARPVVDEGADVSGGSPSVDLKDEWEPTHEMRVAYFMAQGYCYLPKDFPPWVDDMLMRLHRIGYHLSPTPGASSDERQT